MRSTTFSRPLGAMFWRLRGLRLAALIAAAVFAVGGLAVADVPLRDLPGGAVPNPGTQQQELTNITAPAEFNVFEFVVTCAGCHGGSIDQHAAHFSNWAGTSMASAARDPVFRANQIGVNNLVKSITGQDGAGNVCMRCHSPNGWLSGRFDPSLGGKADASNLINSILLSTDAEGISCESCHRVVGNVTNERADLDATDPVWNLLAGISDWPHEGRATTDQDDDPTIGVGLPYGDTSLQFQDGIAYVGKYSGTGDIYFSDLPFGDYYTGQIYAVYPDWWVNANLTDPAGFPIEPAPAGQPVTNSAGQTLAYLPDGTLPPVFEVPIGPPTTLAGVPRYSMQALSLEHPTTGGAGRLNSTVTPPSLLPALASGPGGSASPNEFIRTSEFCGTCHDLTVPILSHGMPEQRTFSEWKHSAYSKNDNVIADPLGKRTGTGVERCQDCHMPTLKHEYSDTNAGSLNPDPLLAGGFPYGKDRGPQGGTAFHKLTGANRDLPMMMKALYPEVDLEVIGAPTGKDPRVFPGMLSDRGPMWDRAQHNTEITLRDGVDVQIAQAPTELAGQPGIYEMKVKVTNKSGHRIPSGYPDGRRFWLEVKASDGTGTAVYESGYYDDAQATLQTTATADFKRAQTNLIDATDPANNAVMVYERVTGTCTDDMGAAIFPDPTAGVPAACTASTSLTNNFIVFDNRVPPKGLDYTNGRLAGVKFWNYDPTTLVPYEDETRYSSEQLTGGYDEVTYRFAAPTGMTLTASADVYWQTKTREFMEHLRDQDTSIVRPEGPPNPFAIGYPFTPTYLSESINGKPLTSIEDPFNPGVALNDNWGGVSYAAWLETGMGAPWLVDRDDTTVTVAPDVSTTILAVEPTGEIDPITGAPDAFAARISWTPVADADGYTIWVRYGKSDTTADWDRLAVVGGDTTSFVEHVFNPAKTYGFKIEAFNGKGSSMSSPVDYTVASDLPAAPSGLTASSTAPGSTGSQITLNWTDNATNDACFDIWRYDVVAAGVPPVTAFLCQVGTPDTTGPTLGQTSWVDTTGLAPNTCYDYQVRAVNNNGDVSTWTQLARGCTLADAGTLNLTATAASGFRVDLSWTGLGAPTVTSFRVIRDGTLLGTVIATAATTYAYADTTVQPATTYAYTVEAMNGGTVVASGSASVTTPAVPVAPTNVVATVDGPTQITVTWTDGDPNDVQDGYVIERAAVEGGVVGGFVPLTLQGAFFTQTSYVDPEVLPGAVYQYRVKAIRLEVGDSAWTYSAQVATPLAPMTSVTIAFDPLPTGPFETNTAVADTGIVVSWADTLNEGGYEVQRCIGNTTASQCGTTGALWATLTSVAADVTTVTDNTVPPGTSNVRYRVRATKTDFTPTAWLNSVPPSLNVPPIPGKPVFTNVSAATSNPAAGLPRVTVDWSGVANDNGYVLERTADNGATWSVIATTNAATTIFVDTAATGLVPGDYAYRVTAVGNGGWNTSVQSTTITLVAPPEATITSVAPPPGTSRTSLSVAFTVPAGGSGWQLQRSLAGADTWTTVSSGTNSGSFTRTSSGLQPGTTYDFRVLTYASGGVVLSQTVSGTTRP